MNPDYPVYIISKGRWETRLTSKALEKMGVPYRDMSETFAEAGEHFSAVVCEDGVHLSPFGLNAYGSVAAMDIRRIMHTG